MRNYKYYIMIELMFLKELTELMLLRELILTKRVHQKSVMFVTIDTF